MTSVVSTGPHMPVMTGCWDIDELALVDYYEQFGGAVPSATRMYQIWHRILRASPTNSSSKSRYSWPNVAPNLRSCQEAGLSS